MIRSPYLATMGALALAAAAVMPAGTFAQAAVATMPPLYNAQGVQVNNGNTGPLAAGTYYLQPGSQPVEYYGNGMYYNTATELYGGSVVNDPNGTAGVSLGYSTSVLAAASPAVPNTGAGGDAPAVAATLILSGIVALAGMAYIGFYSFRHVRAGMS